MSNIPILATIEKVEEVSGKYGLEKVSSVTTDDGGQHKVYTKPAAQSVYGILAPGLRVELMPKSSGAGWLISKASNAPAPDAPALPPNFKPASQAPERVIQPASKKEKWTPEVKGKFIAEKAEHYALAYYYVSNAFDAKDIIVTEDTLRAGAATVLISMDKHMLKW